MVRNDIDIDIIFLKKKKGHVVENESMEYYMINSDKHVFVTIVPKKQFNWFKSNIRKIIVFSVCDGLNPYGGQFGGWSGKGGGRLDFGQLDNSLTEWVLTKAD